MIAVPPVDVAAKSPRGKSSAMIAVPPVESAPPKSPHGKSSAMLAIAPVDVAAPPRFRKTAAMAAVSLPKDLVESTTPTASKAAAAKPKPTTAR
jgi:hypothetical protein